MIELEKAYLAKYIPEGYSSCRFKDIIDIYYPLASEHPILRLRKSGDKMEITKKVKDPEIEGKYIETTIPLTESEYDGLSKADGKRVAKRRYFMDYEDLTAEIDIFKDNLEGLVVVDFEFDDENKKDDFITPDFCLAEVTGNDFLAGGMLCGKRYDEIKAYLDEYGYQKLS